MLKKNKQSLKSKRGFTLSEVLVTVIIVGVLAAIAYPVFSKSIAKARAAEAVNLLEIVKNRQIQNFATKGQYVTDLAKLNNTKLINGTATISGDSLVINDNYYVTLDQENACASVSYKRAGKEVFAFASGYETAGLGCSGPEGNNTFCESFGDVLGSADAVCNVGLGDLPNPNDCNTPVGEKPVCPAGQSGEYTWNTSTCRWEGSCTAIDGWCDGQTRACTKENCTGCSQTCSGTTWSDCTCNDCGACQVGEAGAFGSCPGVCKDDRTGFKCVGENDTHYCESESKCSAKNNACPADTPTQYQSCNDLTHENNPLKRDWSVYTGWSCEFDVVNCTCNPK